MRSAGAQCRRHVRRSDAIPTSDGSSSTRGITLHGSLWGALSMASVRGSRPGESRTGEVAWAVVCVGPSNALTDSFCAARSWRAHGARADVRSRSLSLSLFFDPPS
jgi:hypothetical protein